MSDKHTPGPWLIGRGADGLPIVHTKPDVDSPSGQGVAHICKRPMSQDHVPNARLIAAAPELLEALIALAHWVDSNSTMIPSPMLGQIGAALHKAGVFDWTRAPLFEPAAIASAREPLEMGR